MKLWNVTLETEIVVVADTLEEAGLVAEQSLRDPNFEGIGEDMTVQTVFPFRSLPAGWGDDCIPWGADNADDRRD